MSTDPDRIAEYVRGKKRQHDLKSPVCWCGSTHSWEKAKRLTVNAAGSTGRNDG